VSGEKELTTLVASMQPFLDEQEYVFATLGENALVMPADLEPISSFREAEGLSVIITKVQADDLALSYQGVFQCITLKVHSSLEAIGLTAAVSVALAEQGISANVVAAYYHDHIFVPVSKAHQALTCLTNLAASTNR
jgi:hypothetical protein